MCIYVRDITNDEGNQLKQILRRSNDAFKVKRAQVILASAQCMRVPEIAKSFGFSVDYVRYVIRGFNERGFEVLESKYEKCGSMPKFSNEQRQTVVDVALSKPKDLGLPFTEWSLPKLKDYIIGNTDIDYVSHETIRRILQERGIKYRQTKTWKESNDPDFEIKNKIIELYRNPPTDGRVICLDEFGPLEIRPQLGENWVVKPDLVPATYTRDQGVRDLIAFSLVIG